MLKSKEDDKSKLTHKFVHTSKHIKTQHRFTYAKGVYPYSNVSEPEKFAETRLLPIESFYYTLNDEPLSAEDYERAKQIYEVFGIKTLQQYHDHYLKTDVLLLADVFENFRNTIYGVHRLDPLHFITLPSLAWTTALKRTGAKLDLITDPDMYLMIENNMRGGIATISHRHAVANNPAMNDEYDPSKPHSFITYLDANNLYGTAMSEPLPTGGFGFLDDEQMAAFDVMSIPKNSDSGYIVECDLEYPESLHELHSDYPMAPEHLTISKDMLSNFALYMIGKSWKPFQTLVSNLLHKTKYVCHYHNLQYYISHGLVLKKIHRVIF